MKKNYFYLVVRNIAWFLCKIIFPTRVIGAENVPQDGPVLLCSNHISMIDPVLIAVSVKRRITYMAKKELFGTKFTNWFFRNLGMVPVDRGASDIAAMRICLDVLKEGGLLGIFPQGHRYKQDESREMQNGAALMALRSRVKVVPVHIGAPLKAFRRTTVRFGKPFDFADVTRVNAQAIEAATGRISEGIWQEEK
ncbi:MAG: 1-acyl-sn-glycerol-3-phosphate acyltransferase [Clostridia bacterium]|nr:1-acyl-sn-glycerol-3-phosphate acyltransferase [Clostridia bacterium]